jgi:hypothetical protein
MSNNKQSSVNWEDNDAYKSYVNKINEDFIKSDITLPPSYYPVDKEVFINKIKTDDEFAKTWGNLGYINDIEKIKVKNEQQ